MEHNALAGNVAVQFVLPEVAQPSSLNIRPVKYILVNCIGIPDTTVVQILFFILSRPKAFHLFIITRTLP